MGPKMRELLVAFVAASTLVTAVVVVVTRAESRTAGDASARSPAAEAVDPRTAGAATTVRPVVIRAAPSSSAAEAGRLRAGILVPVAEARSGFVRVLTPCERSGWIAVPDLRLHRRAAGRPDSLDKATIVVDPGHGGSLPGTVGPAGMRESAANLDIALRLATRLRPARVLLTRDADYTAGLSFRTTLADALRAHALVSVHNNAEADGPSPKPGTETYYQVRSPDSKRLAGLVYEEHIAALGHHDVAWTADRDAGAKYRTNARGEDYYHLLRETHVPSVIVEALFLANAPEEQLLNRPEVRDEIATAIARAIERYVESDDPGSGFTTPYPREPGPSGRLPSVCVDPA